jgi:hypothetical protein
VSSTETNDENTVVLVPSSATGPLSAAALKRAADIYLTEYQRLFTHHVFRAFAQQNKTSALVTQRNQNLVEDSSWIAPYQNDTWRVHQRKLFAGT